jgi:hypothetical protein
MVLQFILRNLYDLSRRGITLYEYTSLSLAEKKKNSPLPA